MVKIALVNVIKDFECPPLTLTYLATYITKYNNSEVRIIDINFDDLLKEISEFNPDIIALSAHTITFNRAKNLARNFKQISHAKILIGGVHITTFPKSFTKEFDIGVLGEGEEAFSEIVRLGEKGKINNKELKKIKGILFWNDLEIIKTKERVLMENIDKIPMPDRSFLHKSYFQPKISYNKLRGEKVVEAGLMTSRGCPYKCAFCSASVFWNKIRFHSPKYVAKEVKYLVETFGVNYIVVYDDFFLISPARLNELASELKRHGVLGKVKFSGSSRVNVLNDELCKAMKKLGVVTVNFGFEAGSDKILKMLKDENVTVQKNIEAVKLCRKYDLDVTGSFIVGSPEETLEDMKKTRDVIKTMKDMGASEIWCGVAVPYPGTKLWKHAIKHKLLDEFSWDIADPSYIHNPTFLDKSISLKDFHKIFREIKQISQGMGPQQQLGLLGKIKSRIYYNKTLYLLSGKILNFIPKKTKKDVMKILNITGSLSGR